MLRIWSRVRYVVDVHDQDEIFKVPMLFSAQPDLDTPLNPRLKRRLLEQLQAALAEDAGTDPDSAQDGASDSSPAPDLT